MELGCPGFGAGESFAHLLGGFIARLTLQLEIGNDVAADGLGENVFLENV